jgi:ATP-dependent Clp protease ATP-binding subunit ClpA
MVRPYVCEEVTLDPEKRSTEVLDFERRLLGKIVGQDRAVRRIVNMYQIYLAGMSMPGRPIGNLLFLGPTGSGKTRVVEASAELLFGNSRAFIKVDCAEFQHSHEIAKLIGSPPGYLGHRETSPLLTQEAIDQYQTDRVKMTFILFDEIEKASDSLWQLLLGILDKGTLTLGDNRRVDLSRCVIFMTSNLGAHEMSDMLQGGSIGFNTGIKHDNASLAVLDNKLYRTALDVARRKFSPEFMNRIDKVVVFRTLTEDDLRQILDIELNEVQNRIIASQTDRQFIFRCMPESKEFLLQEGTDLKYGARHLKRAIERHLVYPLSNLIATGQIHQGDIVRIDLSVENQKLVFSRERSFPGFATETPTPVGFAARKATKVGARIAVSEGQAVGVDRLRKA